jgi:hypothetical protein
MLSSAAETWPGPGVLGNVDDTQDEFGQQPPDLR